MRINLIIRTAVLVFIPCFLVNPVRAELSQKQARRLISKAAGMSLPTSAVRIEGINSSNNATTEASTELQLVFRFSRDGAGHWGIKELRTGDAQWESIELLAQAAKLELGQSNCGTIAELGRTKPQSDLTVTEARCLIANLFGVVLPSDAVRVKEISGLSLGSEPSVIVESVVRADFRFIKDSSGWRVSEFHSGNRPWITLESVPPTVDSLKLAKTTEDMNAIAAALEAFRHVRGSFVVTQKHSVLIDHLTPHYLHKVIRLDSWHHPYQYQGSADHFTIRSFGPDGKENTPDDIVVSR